ncbi:MAG TPA: FliM/FliN family flagellar motor switch protein [Bryobacteraceae bacterium]|nr:FliM/FliN family flagellar motor switch protein [Bryobacteraceae bacterium]
MIEDAAPLDFKRLDRIPKSQLSIIQFLHEAFVRNLTASLSAYLRSYVSGSLISVDQLLYGAFLDALPSISCLAYLSMQPHEGHCVVEVNQALVSPILDYLLGGNGTIKTELGRQITDIEQEVLGGFFRVIAHDLVEAWSSVVPINFAVAGIETQPQLGGRVARDEAVVAVAIELRVGEETGIVNIVIPALILKTMRQRLDQQWGSRGALSQEVEKQLRRSLGPHLALDLDCCVMGSTLRLEDYLNLQVGSVMVLRKRADGNVVVRVNGAPKFTGEMTAVEGHHAMVIRSAIGAGES